MNIVKYTILLVEDDPNDVLLMERALGKAKLVNPLTGSRLSPTWRARVPTQTGHAILCLS